MELCLQKLLSGNMLEVEEALKEFLQKILNEFEFPELVDGDYRLKVWEQLISIISIPEHVKLHETCLKIIRILSREKAGLNIIMNKEWLKLFVYHSCLLREKDVEKEHSHGMKLEALKLLTNLIYNSPLALDYCIENGIIDGVICRITTHRNSNDKADILLLDMKILFLITALSAEVRADKEKGSHILKELIILLEFITNCNDSTSKTNELTEEQIAYICEILKVLFNLTLTLNTDGTVEEDQVDFVKVVQILSCLLSKKIENEDNKSKLHTDVANVLINVPERHLKHLYTQIELNSDVPEDKQFETNNLSVVFELLKLFEKALHAQPNADKQFQVLSPITTLLLKCAKSDRILRKYLKSQILPPLRDVTKRPEEGDTLRNYLCRLLTTYIVQLRDLVAELLFVLCKENMAKMIKYTGYGNAAGMIACKGWLCGNNKQNDEYSSESSDSETEEYKEYKPFINSVVGCYEPLPKNDFASLTEEEKEFEAMRLVNILDTITKTGIIKPCKIGSDGRPYPIEHVLELQESLPASTGESSSRDSK